MTDEEALKEIDRQEKRFAAAGFGNGLRLAKSAREYYQTIVKCRQKSAEVAAECAAANTPRDTRAAAKQALRVVRSHISTTAPARTGGRSARPTGKGKSTLGWSGRRDLNPRQPAPKAGALPDCATPR